jgi:hypothetical protein
MNDQAEIVIQTTHSDAKEPAGSAECKMIWARDRDRKTRDGKRGIANE